MAHIGRATAARAGLAAAALALGVASMGLGPAPATATGPSPRALRPIAVTPTSGPAGTTISVSSSGTSCLHHGINDPSVSWPGQVTVRFGHLTADPSGPNEDQWMDTLAKATVIANPDGTWAASVDVPSGATPGSYDVTALCFLPFGKPPWAPSTTVPSTTTPSTVAPSTTTAATTSAPPTSIQPARGGPRTLDSWVIYQPVEFTVTAAVSGGGTGAAPATPVSGGASYTG